MRKIRDKNQNNPIKGLKTIRFWRKRWVIELLGSGPPVIAAIAAAFTLSEPKGIWFITLLVAAVWLVGASLLKVAQAYSEDASVELDARHIGITACLHILHTTIQHQGRLEHPGKQDQDFDLRVTFHRVVEPINDPTKLEQVVDYVGGGGGGSGRSLNIQSGITGQAVRENDVFMMDRDVLDVAEYRRILVSEWHFRKSEAELRRPDRFSAIAVPITSRRDANLVLGVVYADSKMENFFNKSKLQECTVNCCTGLADFIGEHYD